MIITWWRNLWSPHLQQNRDTTRAVVTPVCPPRHSPRSSTSESSTRGCPILNFYINTCQCNHAICILSLSPSFLSLPFSTTPLYTCLRMVYVCVHVGVCTCVLRPQNDITCLPLLLTILFFFFKTKLLTEPEPIDSDCLVNEFQGSTCFCIPVLVPDVCCCVQLLCGCWRSRSLCLHGKHSTAFPTLLFASLCVIVYSTTCSSSSDICFHEYVTICVSQCSDLPVRCYFRWHCSQHSSKCCWCTHAFQSCVVGSRGMRMFSSNWVLKNFPANVLIFTFINNVWKFQLTTFGINSSHLVNLVVMQ